MKNMKFWRTALVATLVLTVMLSVTGGTIAWFTDEVTSASNIIESGNLDIVVSYKTDLKQDWQELTKDSKVFKQGALYEPGYTEIVYLKVENNGTLATKVQAGINAKDTVIGKSVLGNEIALSDYLAIGAFHVQTEDGLSVNLSTREDAVNWVSSSVAGFSDMAMLSDKLENGSLMLNSGDLVLIPDVFETLYMGLVLRMPEEVGNEANHDGTAVPAIELGLNVVATQVPYEKDAFGIDYDAAATYPAYVNSAADLAEALANGGNVTLTGDIEATTPIALGDGANLNLAGNKLTANLTVAEGVNATISNGELVNQSSDNSPIESMGNLTLNDVQVASTRHGVRVEGGETVINGGAYKTSEFAGRTQHALNVSDGATVIVNGGTFVGPKGTAADSGAAVNVQENSTVIINGGSFSGGKNNTLASKGTLIVKGGAFDQDPSAYVADGYKVVGAANLYKVVPADDTTTAVANDNESLKAALQGDATNIIVGAGNYTFPASDVKEGMTLECAEGTVFTGNSSANINGATVKGATFANEDGYAVSGTINANFKDCTFTGDSGMRWATAGETVVFENCVFDGADRGAHFDDGANDVIFKHCTFSGFNAFGAAITKLTLEDCTFKPNGKSKYNGLNLYGNTEVKDCTFVFDGTASEWIDLEGDNVTVEFTNCVVTDGKNEKQFKVGDYGENNTIIINGGTLTK